MTVHLRKMYVDCRYGQLHVHTAFPSSGGFDELDAAACASTRRRCRGACSVRCSPTSAGTAASTRRTCPVTASPTRPSAAVDGRVRGRGRRPARLAAPAAGGPARLAGRLARGRRTRDRAPAAGPPRRAGRRAGVRRAGPRGVQRPALARAGARGRQSPRRGMAAHPSLARRAGVGFAPGRGPRRLRCAPGEAAAWGPSAAANYPAGERLPLLRQPALRAAAPRRVLGHERTCRSADPGVPQAWTCRSRTAVCSTRARARWRATRGTSSTADDHGGAAAPPSLRRSGARRARRTARSRRRSPATRRRARARFRRSRAA